MFCQHCGKESEETNRFCPYCGQPVQQSSIPNQNAPSQQPYSVSGQQNQQQYGTGGYSPQSSYTYNTTPSAPFSQQLSMKWYNFVIWFQLFVSALFSLYNAVRYFTGAHYGEGSAELVYFFLWQWSESFGHCYGNMQRHLYWMGNLCAAAVETLQTSGTHDLYCLSGI